MSDTRKQILLHLATGELISGNQLAQCCGVSRAAVWKHIENLRKEGLAIEVMSGRGYQIKGGLDWLELDVIQESLDIPVTLLEETPSTNDWLMARIARQQGEPLVCLAERQSAGRGTRGRAWRSPFGSNIYCSLYYRFSKAPFELGGLSLAVAVSLVRALEADGISPLGIKWPNDLYMPHGKLGGILIDMSAEANGPSDIVIGVGVNAGMPTVLREQIDQPVADIRDFLETGLPRTMIAITVIRALINTCEQFEQSGFAGFLEYWQGYDMTYGKQVEIHSGSQRIAGIAYGINEQGMIRIDTGDDIRSFSSGDVSLRLQA